MRRRRAWMMIAMMGSMLVSWVPARVAAWDGPNAGRSEGIAPYHETDEGWAIHTTSEVQLVSADVEITHTETIFEDAFMSPGRWRLQATYELAHSGDNPREVTLGLPEPRDSDRDPDALPSNIRRAEGYFDLAISVDGEPVDTRRIADFELSSPYVREGDLHLWEVTVPADGTTTLEVQLSHETMMVGSDPRGHYELQYGSHRLRHWAEPLEEFRIELRLRRRVWGLYFVSGSAKDDRTRPLRLATHEGPSPRKPFTRLEWTADHWTPSFDVQFFLHREDAFSPRPAPLVDVVEGCACPSYSSGATFARADKSEKQAHVERAFTAVKRSGPEGDCTADTTQQWQRLLRRCRNVPYARWGRDFQDERLDTYFYGEREPTDTRPASAGAAWNAPVGPGRSTVDHVPTRFVGLRPNPSYAPSLLAFRDHGYVQLINAMETYLDEHPLETILETSE